jgi:hypothetical protein
MKTGANNSFQPLAAVTGAEAVAAIDRIASMAPAIAARGNTGR